MEYEFTLISTSAVHAVPGPPLIVSLVSKVQPDRKRCHHIAIFSTFEDATSTLLLYAQNDHQRR
jgi:hypothetical protein